MFPLYGFNLPQDIKSDSKGKQNKLRTIKTIEKPSADELQDLFAELNQSAEKPKNSTKASPPSPEFKKEIRRDTKGKRCKDANVGTPDICSKSKKARTSKKNEDGAMAAKTEANAEKSNSGNHSGLKDEGKVGAEICRQLTPMQQKLQEKLSGARFRWINEKLYTSSSESALTLMQKQPEIFDEYHNGFRSQVQHWPEKPLNNIIDLFRSRLEKPLNAPGGLPADPSGEVVVADMGCGEAELALALSKLRGGYKSRKVHFTVHSFDLVKKNSRITVADIAHVPLADQSTHIVVFCLALMGTNLNDFFKEAFRIVKPFGEVWITEIKSRFDVSEAGLDTSRFVNRLKEVGFHHKQTDESNKMFVRFEFVYIPKDKKPKRKFVVKDDEEINKPLLKPCIYKRR